MRHYRKNSDESLRRARREWGASGAPEDYKAFVVERGRMGLHGAVSPEPRGARALLAAWPRYKSGKRKGQPRRKITYGLADKLVRDYYQGAGWLPKISLIPRDSEIPSTHYPAHFMRGSEFPTAALPKGFPPERDPGWAPIQFTALISPDFNTTLSKIGQRVLAFESWTPPGGPWSTLLGAASRWEARTLNEALPWAHRAEFDKKRLAFLLLDASLRVDDPYLPNPPRDAAPEIYVSPRERALTPHEARVRSIAIGLKAGEPWAVEAAADAMAPLIPRGATLVAIPGHKAGRPGIGTSRLVHAIAARTEGHTRCPLERTFQVQSSRDRRRAGKGGLSPRSHAASMKAHPVPQGPLGTPLVLIDNVVVSGATFEGARRALCRPDALGVAYARGRDVILPRANPGNPTIRVVGHDERGFRLQAYDAEGFSVGILSVSYLRWSGSPVAQVEGAYVDDPRKGLGTKLYEKAAELAHRDGRRLISDWERSPESDGFWRKQHSKGRAEMRCMGITPGASLRDCSSRELSAYETDRASGFDRQPSKENSRLDVWALSAPPPASLKNPPRLLPSLEVQRRIASGLDEATANADALLARARRSIELVRKLRMAHLQEAFGSAREIHERLNPVQGLGGLVELRAGGPADFYIQRSGGRDTVGRPFREAFPESEGGARSGPGDPRHHIGVTVLRPDVLDSRFLFYVAEYAWRSQVYRRLCHGTLRLQHLRLKDVACGLSAVVSGVRKNPVSDRGRYRFVHACPAAHCGEDIQDMVDSAHEITYRTFRRKADPGDVRELIAGLGYDHHFPITRDLWHVGFRKSVYRGVPAVYLVHSAIEHIFTLDGELGPSLLEGPREPDPIADAWQAQAQSKTKWGRWAP